MSRRLSWAPQSRADLRGIGDYLALDDPAAAERWVLKLMAAAERAAAAPTPGRRVPELGRDDVREVLVRSYRIVFRLRPKALEVLTVFEGHHLLPDLPLD